jgi:hypothetical protein
MYLSFFDRSLLEVGLTLVVWVFLYYFLLRLARVPYIARC